MKKGYLLGLMVILLVCAFAMPVLASTETGNCGPASNPSSVTWSFDTETGVLVISGSGLMQDYNYNWVAPWDNFRIKQVMINPGVTTIGDEAFEYCHSLTVGNNSRQCYHSWP